MKPFSIRIAACAVIGFVSLLLFSPKAQAQTVVQQSASQGRNEITTVIYMAQPISSSAMLSVTSQLSGGYPGKIVSCTGDSVTQTITFVHKTEFARMELLQLLTQGGYSGVYYFEDGFKVFLNPAGNMELREEQKH